MFFYNPLFAAGQQPAQPPQGATPPTWWDLVRGDSSPMGAPTPQNKRGPGLLGDPAFRIAMGLLSASQDGTINPVSAALSGLGGAADYRELHRQRMAEEQQRLATEATTNQLRAQISDAKGYGPPDAPAAFLRTLAGSGNPNMALAGVKGLTDMHVDEQRIAQQNATAERQLENILLTHCLLYTSPSPRD